MMPLNIEPTLSGILAFTYWAKLHEWTPESFQAAQADACGELAEVREALREAQTVANRQKGEELAWAEKAQQARPGKSTLVTMGAE